MNYLDIILSLPILWGIYRGFTKGFIVSVASLAALILGVYAAIHFSSFTGEYINRWFHPEPQHLKILSFTISFFLVVIIVRIIGWALDKMIKSAVLGFLNRILGVIFNGLKWVIILSVIISILEPIKLTKNLIDDQVRDESSLYHPVSRIAPAMFPYLKFEGLNELKNDSSVQPVGSRQI